jgi:hypothetical protein
LRQGSSGQGLPTGAEQVFDDRGDLAHPDVLVAVRPALAVGVALALDLRRDHDDTPVPDAALGEGRAVDRSASFLQNLG